MSPLAETALQTIARLLLPPETSECIMYILGSFTVLVNELDIDSPMEPGYWKRKDTALDLAAQWISLRRNRDQIRRILSSKCTCTCASLSTGLGLDLHSQGSLLAMYPGFTPAQVLIHCVAYPLRKLVIQMKGITKYTSYYMSTRKAWPYNLQQLLPHGPVATWTGYSPIMTMRNASAKLCKRSPLSSTVGDQSLFVLLSRRVFFLGSSQSLQPADRKT
jgi:hypothetical protein